MSTKTLKISKKDKVKEMTIESVEQDKISKLYGKPFKRKGNGDKIKLLNRMGYKVSIVKLTSQVEPICKDDIYVIAHSYDNKPIVKDILKCAFIRDLRNGRIIRLNERTVPCIDEVKSNVVKKYGYKSYEHYLDVIKAENVLSDEDEQIDAVDLSPDSPNKKKVVELDDLEF